MVSKKTITTEMLIGKGPKKGLPNMKKLREHTFKKSIGMDSSLEETEDLIDPALLNKFNRIE